MTHALAPLLLLVTSLFALACDGPLLLMAGGQLEGPVKTAPADWSFAGDRGLCELETRPAEPYSVNIAYTVLNGVVYINAGDTETQWVENMAEDSNVRLRIDGNIYELRAERVTDRDEIARFGKAWTDQAFFHRDPTGLDPVWIYRLAAR
ncbi:MAG: hypothetical protein JRH19_17830 [Deltaproteobacteria bacterium]|nr:hypothetical protein [Deltaproteobacteria bacterium]